MGVDVVVHGFRSTFRDWCGDEMGTRFPREMFEFALAHDVGDATEQAYRRDRGLQQRFELMNAWAAYCEWPTQTDNVVSLGAKTIPA
jgi:integrase